MGDKVIHILLDGFRPDYIAYAPFLRERAAHSHVTRAEEPFGFETRASFFSGQYPEQSNYSTRLWYFPERSPFRFTKRFAPMLDAGSISGMFEHWSRRLIEAKVRRSTESSSLRHHVSTLRIPFRLLYAFDFPERLLPWEPGYVSGQTLFDVLREHGKKWLYWGWPVRQADGGLANPQLRKDLTEAEFDFAFIHFSRTDQVGHQYGPNSPEMQQAIQQVDEEVKQIVSLVESGDAPVHIMVYGDHGMVEVTRQIDMWSALKRLPVRLGKDYVAFLDSPSARFWFLTERGRIEVTQFLEGFSGGHVLSKQDIASLRSRFVHNRYGDAIWLGDPGTVLFPNFFQSSGDQVKGMHGYHPSAADNQAFFMLHTASKGTPVTVTLPSVINLTDIFSSTLELLGLPVPPSNQGIPFVRTRKEASS